MTCSKRNGDRQSDRFTPAACCSHRHRMMLRRVGATMVPSGMRSRRSQGTHPRFPSTWRCHTAVMRGNSPVTVRPHTPSNTMNWCKSPSPGKLVRSNPGWDPSCGHHVQPPARFPSPIRERSRAHGDGGTPQNATMVPFSTNECPLHVVKGSMVALAKQHPRRCRTASGVAHGHLKLSRNRIRLLSEEGHDKSMTKLLGLGPSESGFCLKRGWGRAHSTLGGLQKPRVVRPRRGSSNSFQNVKD